MPEALDHSIRVLSTVPLSSNRFLSVPSKLLEFLSHQIHQNMQRGIISQRFLILTLRHPSPQQDNNSNTPLGITLLTLSYKYVSQFLLVIFP